ncbi:hypothetical protein OH807_02765 [Kitasatospora sp. NBC_01560]|uniref:hypothetical protein n=1 Tax=Kitasatospora sp. NBC_01560 TaxID=2975965 RepID=UPI00386C6CD6
MAALGLAAAWALFGGTVPPAAAEGSLITVIDNSHSGALIQADSLLEIDRTANLQSGWGSAGSDHDGTGVLVGGLLGVTPPRPTTGSGG